MKPDKLGGYYRYYRQVHNEDKEGNIITQVNVEIDKLRHKDGR